MEYYYYFYYYYIEGKKVLLGTPGNTHVNQQKTLAYYICMPCDSVHHVVVLLLLSTSAYYYFAFVAGVRGGRCNPMRLGGCFKWMVWGCTRGWL